MSVSKNNQIIIIMRKLNGFTKVGLGLIAISLLLSSLNFQLSVSSFAEGFTIGLGLVLTLKGFLTDRKAAAIN
jgi:hypothetical protein